MTLTLLFTAGVTCTNYTSLWAPSGYKAVVSMHRSAHFENALIYYIYYSICRAA